MKCINCGKDGMAPAIEDLPYPASGLPDVVLVGVRVDRCPHCGEYEVEIPEVEALHRVLAHEAVKRTSPLTPAEIRFLRKHLGWTGVEMATTFGVTKETVSRWENGRERMSPTADRLLRATVLLLEPVKGWGIERFRAIGSARAPRPPLRLTRRAGTWQEAA